jgi:hypothetical protein
MATSKIKDDAPTPDAPSTEDNSPGRDAESAPAQESRVVAPEDGTEHGYIGYKPRTEPNDAFTVAGVTGGTANVADTPSSIARKS